MSPATSHPILLLAFFLLSQLAAFGQDTIGCGAVLLGDDLAYQRQFNHSFQTQDPSTRSAYGITHVPVQLHIIQTSAGTGGISAADFTAVLEEVNATYAQAGIHFFQCAAINYIQDDVHYSHDYSERFVLDAAHSVANVINIYCTDVVTSGASNICGYAQFPSSSLDIIVLQTGCAKNNSTFEHELGHYFNLYHTHETALGSELVNGSNCSGAGDYVCDTPADPRLSTATNFTEAGCDYSGSETDGNGSSYFPSVSNYMSYASKSCRTHFTDGQISRMNFALTNDRNYLSCSGIPALEAQFFATMDTSCNTAYSVDFTDVSAGNPTTWSWDFGDGNTSTDQHPTHSYPAAGIYSVTLTVGDGTGSDVYTQSDLVRVGVLSLPYSNDFESGTSSLGAFQRTIAPKNYVNIASAAAFSGSLGLQMDGYRESISAFFQTPTAATAFDSLWNQKYKTRLDLCVDATNYSTLILAFDLRQLYGFNNNYTNFRVLANGNVLGGVYQPAGTDGSWTTVNIDLSAYTGDMVTLSFEGSHKYTTDYQSTNGNATFIDNLSITGTQTLPVELASLDAQPQGRATRLEWATFSEQQNAFFEVQHRRENEPAWQAIGQVEGAGYSSQLSAYSFIDPTPAQFPASRWHYRLRQVDFNGAEFFSDQVSVQFSPISSISIIPNPASGDHVRLVTEAEAGSSIRAVLLDVNGREITHYALDQTQSAWDLSLRDIPNGFYILKLYQNGIIQTRRLQIYRR